MRAFSSNAARTLPVSGLAGVSCPPQATRLLGTPAPTSSVGGEPTVSRLRFADPVSVSLA